MALSTERLIQAAVDKFCAPPGSKMISAGGRNMQVRTPGKRCIHFPDGTMLEIRTDASGVATQVEEDDALHAVVRPRPIALRFAPEFQGAPRV